MIIIFKSQQYWVKWYGVVQVISRHEINPSLTKFVWKFDRKIIWNFYVIRPLYQASALNTLISFEVQFYVDCQNINQYTIKAGHNI